MNHHEEEDIVGFPKAQISAVYAIMAATVTVMAWLYGWLYGLDGRLESHIKVQEQEMKAIDARFSVGSDDRYRGSQARSDFALRDEQIVRLREQFADIKKDLEEIKKILINRPH